MPLSQPQGIMLSMLTVRVFIASVHIDSDITELQQPVTILILQGLKTKCRK